MIEKGYTNAEKTAKEDEILAVLQHGPRTSFGSGRLTDGALQRLKSAGLIVHVRKNSGALRFGWMLVEQGWRK